MNSKKLRSLTRATLTNPNFQSFCKLEKSLKYSLRPTFKNPSFESKDELRKAMSQFREIKRIHKIRLVTFQT